jgi:hypothetical protein
MPTNGAPPPTDLPRACIALEADPAAAAKSPQPETKAVNAALAVYAGEGWQLHTVRNEYGEQLYRMVNTRQPPATDPTNSEADALQDRMDRVNRHITIVDRSGSRTVAFTDETDTALRKWLRDTIFGGGSTPVGVHARNGQIASAMPFKEGSDGFRRLKAAGLVDRSGQNYHYVGPQNVREALQKLQEPQR